MVERNCLGQGRLALGHNMRWLNDYYGRVQDILSDGHRVRIKALPNNNTFYSGLSSDAWVNYDYNDSDSWTQFRLEKVRVSDSALTAWGTWGVNRGF